MPLSAGAKLGPYEILAPLGAGEACEISDTFEAGLRNHCLRCR
jgi:hypothetical protein